MYDPHASHAAESTREMQQQSARLMLETTKQTIAFLVMLIKKMQEMQQRQQENNTDQSQEQQQNNNGSQQGTSQSSTPTTGQVDTSMDELAGLQKTISELSEQIDKMTNAMETDSTQESGSRTRFLPLQNEDPNETHPLHLLNSEQGNNPSTEDPQIKVLLGAIRDLSKEVQALKAQQSSQGNQTNENISLEKQPPQAQNHLADGSSEEAMVSVLDAIENNIVENSEQALDGDRETINALKQLQGLSSVGTKLREFFGNIRSAISDGITRLTGGHSLASDLEKQSTISQFANKLLDAYGVEQDDGSVKVKGNHYEFSKSSEGYLSIKDTKGKRGQIFGLYQGAMYDKLSSKDISNFAAAASIVKRETQRQQSSQEIG